MFCQELQQQNDFLHHQLQAAKVEIIALRGGKIPLGPVEMKPSFTPRTMEDHIKVGKLKEMHRCGA
jgi:hypothetical protein